MLCIINLFVWCFANSWCAKFSRSIISIRVSAAITITETHHRRRPHKKCSFQSTMAKSIRSLLSPLLIMSYVCGLRIVEFPTGHPRFWFSFLYILLLWSTFCFFVIDKGMPYIPDYSADYRIYVSLNIFIVLLSMLLGVYHDKVGKKSQLFAHTHQQYTRMISIEFGDRAYLYIK